MSKPNDWLCSLQSLFWLDRVRLLVIRPRPGMRMTWEDLGAPHTHTHWILLACQDQNGKQTAARSIGSGWPKKLLQSFAHDFHGASKKGFHLACP